MPNVSDAIADAVTSHETDLLRLESHYRRKARNRLRVLEEDLTLQLDRIYRDEPVRITTRQRRLEKLREVTGESINNSYVGARREFKADLRDFSRTEAEATPVVLNRAMGVNLFDVSANPATLRSIVDGALIEGTPLSQHWSRQARNTRERFNSQVGIGVLAGEDLGQLRQRVRGRFTGRYSTFTDADGKKRRVGIYEGGIMTTSRREADALIRTATQNVANQVRDETIKNNADIVKGRQALVTLDGRTSPICISRSGHAWDLEGNPVEGSGATQPYPGPPPWHVNCRTTLIPLLRSWAELAGPRSKISKEKLNRLETAGRRTQASMDGQVAANLNYEQWLKRKSKSFQDQVLGKGKARLWRRGAISSLSQLVDQTGRPITLKQFRRRAGLPEEESRISVARAAFSAISAVPLVPAIGLAGLVARRASLSKIIQQLTAVGAGTAAGGAAGLAVGAAVGGPVGVVGAAVASTVAGELVAARVLLRETDTKIAALEGGLSALPDLRPKIKSGAIDPQAQFARTVERQNGLYPVQIVSGEKWCGPACVSAMTGVDTLAAANLIRAQRGLPEGVGDVVATRFGEVLEATRQALPEGYRIGGESRLFVEGQTRLPLNPTAGSVEDWLQTFGSGQTSVVLWMPVEQEFHWMVASRVGDDIFVVDNGAYAKTTPVRLDTVSVLTDAGPQGAKVQGYFRVE